MLKCLELHKPQLCIKNQDPTIHCWQRWHWRSRCWMHWTWWMTRWKWRKIRKWLSTKLWLHRGMSSGNTNNKTSHFLCRINTTSLLQGNPIKHTWYCKFSPPTKAQQLVGWLAIAHQQLQIFKFQQPIPGEKSSFPFTHLDPIQCKLTVLCDYPHTSNLA